MRKVIEKRGKHWIIGVDVKTDLSECDFLPWKTLIKNSAFGRRSPIFQISPDKISFTKIGTLEEIQPKSKMAKIKLRKFVNPDDFKNSSLYFDNVRFCGRTTFIKTGYLVSDSIGNESTCPTLQLLSTDSKPEDSEQRNINHVQATTKYEHEIHDTHNIVYFDYQSYEFCASVQKCTSGIMDVPSISKLFYQEIIKAFSSNLYISIRTSEGIKILGTVKKISKFEEVDGFTILKRIDLRGLFVRKNVEDLIDTSYTTYTFSFKRDENGHIEYLLIEEPLTETLNNKERGDLK